LLKATFRKMKTKSIMGIAALTALAAFLFAGSKPFGSANSPTIEPNKVRALIETNIRSAVKAPEFPAGLDWLNTSSPLTLAELKGKIVLLDFWTFCCINCMHVIPDLKYLEKTFPDQLAVVGVHSAKFENEQNTERIRQSILRYEITHPVVNDNRFQIWQSFGVRAWPTLILIDPEGNVVLNVSGEGHRELLKSAIEVLTTIYEGKGLTKEPLPVSAETRGEEETSLRFPGKMLVSQGKIYISDSNHNRILVTDMEGRVEEAIGSGEQGRRDGPFESAAFHHPQGLALYGDQLFIADTEQHLIRAADFKTRTVKTVAGTGEQAQSGKKGKALETSISSPWDLALAGDRLFIAMAGLHQIWVLDLKQNLIEPFAGSRREDIIDGPLDSSALAQPSGITFDGDHTLYFVDSETSSVRSIDLNKGRVETLVGTGLFDFGNKTGSYRETQLQHPLGVHYHEGKLYVADTYNNAIKIFHVSEKRTETFQASGLALEEPGGLWVEKNTLYIADTNHHKLTAVDLDKRFAREINVRFEELIKP